MAEFEHRARLIRSIGGTVATIDGKHVLIKLIDAANAEMHLAVPPDQVNRLIELGALGVTKCNAITGGDPGRRFSLPTNRVEVGHIDFGAVAVTMTFGDGGQLTFHLDPALAEQLRDGIVRELGNPRRQRL